MAVTNLPVGTVTFLFTDIEGSTRLLQALGGRYEEVLSTHHRLVREAIEGNGGMEISTEGDSFFCVFPTAGAALAAAAAAQRALASEDWPEKAEVRVRMGLHSGEGAIADDTYVGLDVHRAARIAAAAHGGQVLLSAATRALAEQNMPEGTTLRGIGTHRLKDLSQPEELFQLMVTGLQLEFPPLRTIDATPNNLPIHLTSFIGRQEELEEITALMSSSRLITLHGPGGVGKTRLALQAAATRLEAFSDGTWLVDLTATADPDLVPSLVAEPLGVRDTGTSEAHRLTDILAGYLADKELLLIMDNCEHVREAAARLTERLLSTSPRLCVLATSRESLGVAGEIEWHVPPLDIDAEAVQLLVDRAQQLRPQLRLGEAEQETAREIAQRLDGLPLAIELAASRVNILTFDQILQRLEDRFALLRDGRSTAAARHETLLATMDWSYSLLSDEEKAALRRLSVFSGWSLEAAEAVLAADRALDLLASLKDKSLVEATPGGAHSRFRLLGTVRQYALDRLAAEDEEGEARLTHASYFLDFVERADGAVRSPEQKTWLQQLEADHDNVRAALSWAIDAGEGELALRLVAAMSWFWFIEGYWQGPRQWFKRVYDSTPGADPVQRARAVYKSAGISLIWGRFTESGDLIEEAYAVLAEQGTPRDVAFVTHFLGEVRVARGDEAALELLEESIARFDELGDLWGQAFSRRWLGSATELSGDPERNVAWQRESVEGFQRLGDQFSTGWMAFVLGYNLVSMGELDEAKHHFELSLSLAAETEGRLLVPHAKRGLAMVAAQSGQLDRARELLEDVLPMSEKIGDENCVSIGHMLLGELLTDLEEEKAAKRHLRQGLEGFQRMGNSAGLAAALRRAARLADAAGAHARAARLLGAAETQMVVGRKSSMPAYERARYEEVRGHAEKALGAADFAQLFAEGASMSEAAALSYALENGDPGNRARISG